MIYARALGITPADVFDDVGDLVLTPQTAANGVGQNEAANTLIRGLKAALNRVLGEARFPLTGTVGDPGPQQIDNAVVLAIQEALARLPADSFESQQALEEGISWRAASVAMLAQPQNLATTYNFFDGFGTESGLRVLPALPTARAKTNTLAIAGGIFLAFAGLGTVFYLLQRR